MTQSIHSAIDQTFRAENGRVFATLIGSLRDFQLAEDVLQEAIIVALEKWPTAGIPRNPAAWLTTNRFTPTLPDTASLVYGLIFGEAGILKDCSKTST